MRALVQRVSHASVTIDGEVHAKMDPETALALLEDIRAREGAANG